MGSEVAMLVKTWLQMAKGREKQAGFVLVWFVFFVLKAVIVRVTVLTEKCSNTLHEKCLYYKLVF